MVAKRPPQPSVYRFGLRFGANYGVLFTVRLYKTELEHVLPHRPRAERPTVPGLSQTVPSTSPASTPCAPRGFWEHWPITYRDGWRCVGWKTIGSLLRQNSDCLLNYWLSDSLALLPLLRKEKYRLEKQYEICIVVGFCLF